MKKTAITTVLMICAAAAQADSRQFTASEVAGVRLKRSGTIVISNDAKAIRATHVAANRKTTLVEIRSPRRPVAPAPVALASAPVARASVPVAHAPAPVAQRPSGTRRAVHVPASLAAIFEEAAQRYSLDPLLLAAVARQESRFQPHAVSPVGARGVMQLMPRTAASLGVTNAFDPRQNILGGAKYLKMLLDQFRGDVDLSLAAYNAGPGAVRKYRGIPPYRETTNYVAAIRRDYDASRR